MSEQINLTFDGFAFEPLEVTWTDHGVCRLDESPVFSLTEEQAEIGRGDVIAVRPLDRAREADGPASYHFERLVASAPTRRYLWVLGEAFATSRELAAFCDEVERVGGTWERIAHGVLIVYWPANAPGDPQAALDSALERFHRSADERLQAELRRDVVYLAETIGERNLERPAQLARAADWLEASLKDAGCQVVRLGFEVDGQIAVNIEATLPGPIRSDEIIVVGAHYDTVYGTPGADDNASGVAALLAIARALAGTRIGRAIRFVAFVNEEPPYFHSDTMGSLVYARACRARGENVVGMIALESIGYYTDAPGSQSLPIPPGIVDEPVAGNFLALVANPASAELLASFADAFQAGTPFPVVPVALAEDVQGVGWSDHWSFWEVGYPAVMATDTAVFRNPHYHQETDTPATVCYPELAAVTRGLTAAVERLARG